MTRRSRPGTGLATLLALACSRPPEPEGKPPTVEPAKLEAPAPAPPLRATPVAPPRACDPGERLDSGCTCRSGGACFDICCGENAGCAHPAVPGGPSACILRPLPAPAPRACTDGESLASGCRCDDRRCMDICCVGSACSHSASPEGGSAKCIRLPKRRP